MYSTDPSIGARTGFGGVILHGLSTYGFAARHLVSAIGRNEPSSLKYFSVRFTSPVRPGDELETRAWELGGLGSTHGAFRFLGVSFLVRVLRRTVGEDMLEEC